MSTAHLRPLRSDETDSAFDPIIEQATNHDGSSPLSDQAVLAAKQGQRELFAVVPDREPGRPEGEEPIGVGVIGQGEVDLVIAPDRRGHGFGGAAFRELTARAHGELRAWVHGDQPAAEHLLESSGFRPVRTLLRMSFPTERLPASADPFAVPFPAGLRLRPYEATNPSDAPAWVSANAAAFHDHPEQGKITEDDFALMRSEDWFDADDLLLLEEQTDGEQGSGEGEPLSAPAVVGFTWVKTLDAAPPECELYALGVRPERAGQGLGRALLDATFARMAQHRPGAVTLYVDGENIPAVRLYERAGFTVAKQSRQWLRSADSAR